MRKYAVILVGFFALSTFVSAQDQLTEIYVKEHIPNKKAVPYEYIREADVMWSKVVYRMVDLRQTQNMVLYYPTKPIGNRMNFIDLLFQGIQNEGIRAFSTMDPVNEFTNQMTLDDIEKVFDSGVDTVSTVDPFTGQVITQIVPRERKTDQVKKLLIKEKWFFDKNHSVMKVRIIGICPLRVYYRTDDQGVETDELLQKKTFWVYFPEIRPLLANHEMYNRFNDSQSISFDNFFMQRRFNSHIFSVSNVYDNRNINAYTVGVDALLEAEQLKTWLFNIEHDLWEY